MSACKTCGGKDHIRASSAKCLQHIPKQSKRFLSSTIVGATTTTDTFTVKCGLLKLIKKDEKLLEAIEHQVRTISELSIETSLYILWRYTSLLDTLLLPTSGILSRDYTKIWTNKKPVFIKYFYHLQGKQMDDIARQYQREFRRDDDDDKQFYNGTHKSFLITSAAKQYETMLMNSVCTHAFARVYNYFFTFYFHKEKDKAFGRTLEIFTDVRPRTCFTQKFLEYYGFEDDNPFKSIQKNWWSLVPFFYYMGKRLLQHERVDTTTRGSFKLFPVYKHGRHHVLYNAASLYELLSSVKYLPKGITSVQFRQRTLQYWSTHFSQKMIGKYISDDLETLNFINDKSFAMSFSTNGVDASVQMQRLQLRRNTTTETKKMKTNESAQQEQQQQQEPQQEHQWQRYDFVIGLDPGLVQMFGAVVQDKRRDVETNVMLRGKTFRQSCMKAWRRRKKRGSEQANVDERYKRHIQTLNNYSYKIGGNIDLFVRTNLEWFDRRQRVYATRVMTRKKFDRFVCRRRALDKIANSFVEYCGINRYRHSTKSMLVCYGEGQLRKGVKYGHGKLPNNELIRAFARLEKRWDLRGRVKMKIVPEYNTTRLCNICWCPMKKTSKNKHRFQVCPNCGVVFNRDINGARNIAELGQRQDEEQLRPRRPIEFTQSQNLAGQHVVPSEFRLYNSSRVIRSKFVSLHYRIQV